MSSGPPILLDPSCIVTKDSAQLYGRDFIPNVCLKPVATPNATGSSGQSQLHLSRSLPSVPSNEDIVASSVTEKRLSEADLYPDLKISSGHRSRPILRGPFGLPLSSGGEVNLFQHSNQGLNSIDSSPARVRHSSSTHDTALSNPLDLHKRCATEEVLRCPSVDSAPASSFRGQLNRTTSYPDLNSSTSIRLGLKRERTGSWSLTPISSGVSPSRRKRLLEPAPAISKLVVSSTFIPAKLAWRYLSLSFLKLVFMYQIRRAGDFLSIASFSLHFVCGCLN